MRIFISAGEPSGDLHAANLIHSLRVCFPDAHFDGFGGERDGGGGRAAAVPARQPRRHVVFERSAQPGDVHSPGLHGRSPLSRRKARRGRARRLSGPALVDCPPGQGAGIPVFYFVPPQIWAWAGWRVNKVRKYVDQVLCSLPFEPAWYHARGVSQTRYYVGHPYFDELADRPLDETFLSRADARGMVRWWRSFPVRGRRKSRAILPDMVRAAAEARCVSVPVFVSPWLACTSDTRSLAEGIIAPDPRPGRHTAGPVDRGSRWTHRRADPARTRRVGRLGLGRARADGGSVAVRCALQDQALRSLGGPMVHQVEIHQPGQSPGRRQWCFPST